MTVITVHSFKGGTGKSLIAVSLAYYFSMQKEKVLIIDGDYFAPCRSNFFPPKSRTPYFTSFLQGKSLFNQIISKTRFKNLDISYSPPPNFSQEILTADSSTHGRYLKKILEGIEICKTLKYDKVIFDNSSGVTLSAINQLTCSNQSIIVLRPISYGIEATLELVNHIYKKPRYLNADSRRQDYLVWNQVPFSSDSTQNSQIQKYLNQWTEKFDRANLVYGTTIPYSNELTSAMILGKSIDLPFITHLIKPYIEELVGKLAILRK